MTEIHLTTDEERREHLHRDSIIGEVRLGGDGFTVLAQNGWQIVNTHSDYFSDGESQYIAQRIVDMWNSTRHLANNRRK